MKKLMQFASKSCLKTFGCVLASLWLTACSLLAEISSTKCYDADEDKIFLTSDIINLDASLETRLPQTSTPEKGSNGLTWVPAPPQTTVENEKIGAYQGREIYRIVYRTTSQKPDGSSPGILCIVFAYKGTNEQGAQGLRPFFIRTEDIRWFESYFTADKTQPFGLLISITREGNGLFSAEYNFAFTQQEARITERSESGRHMRTKTYEYNSSGKVIRISVADSE